MGVGKKSLREFRERLERGRGTKKVSSGKTGERSQKQAALRGVPRGRSFEIRPFYAGTSRKEGSLELAVGHLLSHVQNELAIFFVGFAQQSAKLVEKASFLAARAPGDIVRRLSLGQVRQYGRLFAVVEELIEWAFESAGHLLQCFNGRYRMAILDSGNITTKQTRTLFNIALGEFLFLTQCAEAITDNHAGIIPCR